MTEQINQHDYIRGGRALSDFSGRTAGNKVILWTDHHNPGIPSKGQKVRERFEDVHIRFERDEFGRGVLASIKTTGKLALLANDGTWWADTAYPREGDANEQDEQDFIDMFQAIIASLRNFRVRKYEGHNYMPVATLDEAGKPVDIPDEWYEAGNRVVDGVAYTTASAPTHNYDTHRVDGTPITPEKDAEATV
ncbi:hypothetical protein [uncultured Pontibacter sp.]|uniref:hypothetical protein n=1 Tax=uncultured Pontibacter sp. TaxID=453356 RepID=UPI0026151A72|nr:hypothetical protein [uncultured Pontibacter sp.]